MGPIKNKYIIKYYNSATFLQNLNQQFEFIKVLDSLKYDM